MRKTFKEFFVNSFFTYLAIELVEEVIEDLIAVGISSLLTKAISTLFVISISQGTKIVIKTCIKRYTYKEGNDKMKVIKTVLSWLNANKFSLLGTLSTAATVMSGTGVIDVSVLPALYIHTFNITPILYYAILGLFSILGISKKGWEKIQDYLARLKTEKLKAEEKANAKIARAEYANEKKIANQSKAEQEARAAKEQAARVAAEEKERAEKEKRAKIDAIKEELRKQDENKAVTNIVNQ